MPELPEVEITARLLDAALAGARVTRARAPGLNVMKTFAPRLDALVDAEIVGVARRGKHLAVTFSGAAPEHARLHLLLHLMSAGRLQLFDQPAGPRDRTSRLLIGLDGEGEGDRELRLREFGTKQAAWAMLVEGDEALEAVPRLATLGPEAWPDPPAPAELATLLAAAGARPLYSVLRDQRVVAGIGRSWVDEILWSARLSPFQRATDLDEELATRLRDAMVGRLGGAIEHYAATLALPLPDKLPLPLQVHRHAGEPCPRCGTTIAAIHYESYVLCYCPEEQTGGRVLKDRRLSRLLK